MHPFITYKINETEQGIEVILYLDEHLTEFSDELGKVTTKEKDNLEKEAVGFVKTMFPSLKVKTVKIMAGALLVTSLGFGTLSANAASAAETKTTDSKANGSSYTVVAGDTLSGIAKRYSTTVNAIKQANQLTSDFLQIGQTLTVPSGAVTGTTQTTSNTYQVVSGDTLSAIAKRYGTTVDAIKQASQLTSDFLQIGQALTIPSVAVTDTTQETSNTYQVVSGDTLSDIAKRYGTTVNAIKQDNHLTSDFLQIGQTLKIPSGAVTDTTQSTSNTYQVASGDTLYAIAKRYGTSVDAIKQANHLTSDFLQIGQTLTISSEAVIDTTQTTSNSYQVVSGDTLTGISKRYATTVDAIKQANQLISDFLRIGQTLIIPSETTVTNPASSPKTEEIEQVSQEDVEWLAKMIYSEGRGESLEGQIAVGAVIMNRVESPLFPNNVKDVLFEQSNGYYQFTPAQTGAIYDATPTPENIEAAKRALQGEDPTNGALFFYNPDKTNSEYLKSRTVATIIGNHTFAY